jgi:hypothetical protein
MNDQPTPKMDSYKYHAEDGGWIAAPNNGGDIGGLPEIAEELTRLARERNEARKHRDEWFAAFLKATKRAGDMREQRDRLAEALREIGSGKWGWAEMANDALAALKKGNDE